ncbi:MAG: SDR family NAD(P)-dependent oxidoreductase, partial [Candidatus Latescibacterota bacterium]
MSRFAKKVVLITGASSGFGKASAQRFAAEGADLVLWARRLERLEELKGDLEKRFGVRVRIDRVDVREREDVLALGRDLANEGTIPDILVNNAGLASGLDKIHEGDFDDWDRMIDTNLKGLLNVTRAILPGMVERNAGHVINIGSIAGRMAYPMGNVYNATKFAVHALNDAMNIDLVGTRIRVSTVDPGAAETEFSDVRFHGDKESAKAVYKGFDPLTADDVADAILYVAGTPEHVN